ncbi:unnamed protein product [Symbiodinium microadriaticum]|nr:unnamed protein product [Symbiodinium microadriaticum]
MVREPSLQPVRRTIKMASSSYLAPLRRFCTASRLRSPARRAVHTAMPSLDISPFLSGGSGAEKQRCAREFDRACRSTGFFYLDGHGVSEHEVQNLHRLAREFFALPSAAKEAIALRSDEDFARGYQKLGMNVTKNEKDWQEAIDFFAEARTGSVNLSSMSSLQGIDAKELERVQQFVEGRNRWPEEPADFKRVVEAYFAKMATVGSALTRAMATAFGLPENHFDPMMNDSFWGARIIGYPALPVDAPGLSCGEHTDYGCWIILAQDETQGALEAKLPCGRWEAIPPVPGKLVVNLGDMLSVWTRGHWVATEHRVRHTSANFRTSVVYFHEPNFDAVIRPLDLSTVPRPDVQPGSPALARGLAGESCVYGEHLFARVSQNYDFSV